MPQRQGGAALAVLILVLAGLLAILMFGNALSPLQGRIGDSSRNQGAFDALDAAIIQFAQSNLRLPCPANGLSVTGLEDTTAPTNTTTCLSPAGVVPWATLGLPKTAAQDSEGRLVSYRAYHGSSGFTRTGGLDLSNCLDSDVTPVYALSGASGTACNSTTHENSRGDFLAGKGLSVNDRGSSKSQVAYALVSHGDSGYGAYVPSTSPSRMTMPDADSKEYLNAGSAGTYWILEPSSADVSPGDANHFDDAVRYKLASDLVLAAKIGGRPWPLSALLDRVNTTGSASPTDGNVNTGVSSRKIAANGGPVMVTAFADGSTRYISSVDTNLAPPFKYAIGAARTSGSGSALTTSGDEGLTFDFRVKRRYLKITFADFKILSLHPEQARLTFYDGSTQVAQGTARACSLLLRPAANFVIDVDAMASGKQFTKVTVQALDLFGSGSSSNISISSIAACMYDDASHPACSLPNQDAANDCTGGLVL